MDLPMQGAEAAERRDVAIMDAGARVAMRRMARGETRDKGVTLDEWLAAAAAWCGSDDPVVRAMGIAKIGEVAAELVARGIE